MTNHTMPAFLRPLALSAVDEIHGVSLVRPSGEVALELLSELVRDHEDPLAVVRSRYRQVTNEETEPLIVPDHDSIMRHVIRPLREAKQCYVLRMPVACIAQAGLVGEMVALWRFRMLQPKLDGRPLTEELQKLLLGREFDKLGQEERVRVLRALEHVDDDVIAAFGELRAVRRKYLHFMVDLATDIDADARRALQYAALLVVRTLGATFNDGAMVLPARVSRYIADIIQIDASVKLGAADDT